MAELPENVSIKVNLDTGEFEEMRKRFAAFQMAGSLLDPGATMRSALRVASWLVNGVDMGDPAEDEHEEHETLELRDGNGRVIVHDPTKGF